MARRGENIYKHKDGRYEGRYVIGRTAQGHTRFGYVYGRQYAAVREELVKRKTESAENRGCASGGSMTVSEWMERWMQSELKGRVRQSSFQTYINMYKHHLRPGIGSCLITRVTTENIRSLIESLYKKGLADSTVRGIYRLLAAAMKCAHEEDIIRRNPCARIRLQRSMSREQRVLNKVESGRICDEAQVRTDLPTLLGMYTGMRLGEICALKWEDIDWTQKTIFVRLCAQRIAARSGSTEKTALIVGEPKSLKSRRIIPVPEFILILLKKTADKRGVRLCFRHGNTRRRTENHSAQIRRADQAARLERRTLPHTPAPVCQAHDKNF